MMLLIVLEIAALLKFIKVSFICGKYYFYIILKFSRLLKKDAYPIVVFIIYNYVPLKNPFSPSSYFIYLIILNIPI